MGRKESNQTNKKHLIFISLHFSYTHPLKQFEMINILKRASSEDRDQRRHEPSEIKVSSVHLAAIKGLMISSCPQRKRAQAELNLRCALVYFFGFAWHWLASLIALTCNNIDCHNKTLHKAIREVICQTIRA